MKNTYQDINYLSNSRGYREEENEEKERSFFSTLAGKIAIGVSGTVVLASLVVGGLIFLGKKNDQGVVNAETTESMINVDLLRGYMEGTTEAEKSDESHVSEQRKVQELTAKAEAGQEVVREETTTAYVETVIAEEETKANVQIPDGEMDCFEEKVADWTEEAKEQEAAKKAEEEAKRPEEEEAGKQEEVKKAEEQKESLKLATSSKPAKDTTTVSTDEDPVSGSVTLSMACNKQNMEGQTFYLYPAWKSNNFLGYLMYSPARGWDLSLSKEDRLEVTFGENGETTLDLEDGRWVLTEDEDMTFEEVYIFDVTKDQIRDHGTISIGMQYLPDRFKDASGNGFEVYADGTVEGYSLDENGDKKEYTAQFEIVSNEYTSEELGLTSRSEHWTVTMKCTNVETDQQAEIPFVQGQEYTLSGDRIVGDFWMDSDAGLINWDFEILDEEGNETGFVLKR